MENSCKPVLIVTNSTQQKQPVANIIINKVRMLSNNEYDFHLLHVIPKIPESFFMIPSVTNIEQQLISEAWDKLNLIGNTLSIPKENRWVASGNKIQKIMQRAKMLNAKHIITTNREAFKFISPQKTNPLLDVLSEVWN